MTSFHGLPLGGGRDQPDLPAFLRGRHAMVSFAHPCQLSLALDCCASVALDNGAFSLWKANGGRGYDEATYERYASWVGTLANEPALAWAVIPDAIGGTDEDNDRLVEAWPVELRPVGVPVWHLHEPVERLSRLCAEWPRVALGSSGAYSTPGNTAWWGRMGEAMSAVCDESGRPRARLHGLRMLSEGIVSRLPLASADSTDAVRNARSISRFGTYVPTTEAQRAGIIADRIEGRLAARAWDPALTSTAFTLFD